MVNKQTFCICSYFTAHTHRQSHVEKSFYNFAGFSRPEKVAKLVSLRGVEVSFLEENIWISWISSAEMDKGKLWSVSRSAKKIGVLGFAAAC